MPTIEYWIQLENRPWDASPHGRDRMSGQKLQDITGKPPVSVTLHSPGTGVTRTRTMYNPIRDENGDVTDALILRRYKPPVRADQSDAWTVPDDRKVNPWDVNEVDPTDTGTMGTIPGPVLECNVGDQVIVHFRNRDHRTETVAGTQTICLPGGLLGEQVCIPFPTRVQKPIAIEQRVHSLHPHGFVFERAKDGAYPLSPPDPAQPIPASEAAAWASVPKFSGSLKQGDRVPPDGTFTYEWNTFGWPTTAGVWLYHDHSISDMDNVGLGAIGIIVIHNPADVDQEVDIRLPDDPAAADPNLLPSGSLVGSPITVHCLPTGDIPVSPHQLIGLGSVTPRGSTGGADDMAGMAGMADTASTPAAKPSRTKKASARDKLVAADLADKVALDRSVVLDGMHFELSNDLSSIARFCLPVYLTPPSRALYLQLFHSLSGVSGMAINGRTYLGNTPTMIAGTSTRMRFGVVGMGSDVHTFHIHGHRWAMPGPDGAGQSNIQNSAQVAAVSQFEDTRIFGAANSFVFTINEASGSFMRAGGPGPDQALGEWHMHCHVLAHMMSGMMGSLLIIRGGELALALPEGVPSEMPSTGGTGGMGGMGGSGSSTPATHQVTMQGVSFSPSSITINRGDTVEWHNDADAHTVTSNPGTMGCTPHSTESFTLGSQSNPLNANQVASHTFNTSGSFSYHCEIHGCSMSGTVHVN